ncbi:unnamed protein product [Clonostachys solani]|uniref:Uncharacterized protein n=1 Tax=Clonostachys solani TaxID=160281 RepID=A0A9N9Z0R3_9HYPO|nr:unnamed protein product [Clonostachys solani]
MSSSIIITSAANANEKVAPPMVPLELSFDPEVLDSLAKWFHPRSADGDWWWEIMGGHLETMLSAAGYSITDQSIALLFFYHWVSPRLGPRPTSSKADWKSFMTDDHSPVEYSWKWGFGDDAPAVRYSIEPIGCHAGTRDILNQKATCELLTQLHRSRLQGLDLDWFNHFKHALLGPGTPAFKSKAANLSQSTLFMSFEIADAARPVGVKAYFLPVDAPGNSSSEQIFRAIASTCPNLVAVNQLQGFLCDDVHGRTIRPFMLGIDCVSSTKSRLKIYSRSRATSFDMVRRVMSVGGQRRGLEEAEKELHQLWKLTLGLPDDFPVNKELPFNSHETAGVLFYFDVAPDKRALPDVKVYIPVRHYAPSDEVSANGLVQYLNSQGRGAYTQQYLETLETLAIGESMSESNGVQTYISCAYNNSGKLVITSYITPQFYHPHWFEGGLGN